MKQHALDKKAGILAAGKYWPGDLVSMDQYVCTTPGHLMSGFGRKANHNQYHGGTIFNDAASGAIRVEHQASLGAADTLTLKDRFKEWLYDLACTKVRQYHSDNDIFAASDFKKDCDGKHQCQSFSGIGAKRQNGQAERAIQTILYMARTFMIHVLLHWNERGGDDISLWPFTVQHAVW